MSRIITPPVKEGTEVVAVALNARFSQFNQPGALDATNTRDAAFDLAHFDGGFILKNSASGTIGKVDFDHSSPVAVNSYAGGSFPAGSYVTDGAAATYLSLGALGWVIGASDVVRIYWNLGVQPTIPAAGPWPWRTGGRGDLTFATYGGGADETVGDGAHCWVFWMEWDVTDNTLTNWVPVTGQGDFSTDIRGDASVYGGSLASTRATTMVPAYIDRLEGAREGLNNSGSTVSELRWIHANGAYIYMGSEGARTIYGLRLRVAGLAHAYSYSNTNYLVWDPAVADAAITLEHTSGAITALHHSIG